MIRTKNPKSSQIFLTFPPFSQQPNSICSLKKETFCCTRSKQQSNNLHHQQQHQNYILKKKSPFSTKFRRKIKTTRWSFELLGISKALGAAGSLRRSEAGGEDSGDGPSGGGDRIPAAAIGEGGWLAVWGADLGRSVATAVRRAPVAEAAPATFHGALYWREKIGG